MNKKLLIGIIMLCSIIFTGCVDADVTVDIDKDKQNKSIEDLTYDILGNAFVGNLFDISNDIDNTSQNLVAYLELEDIKKLSKKHKGNIEEK